MPLDGLKMTKFLNWISTGVLYTWNFLSLMAFLNLSRHDCNHATFPPLLVGAEACGACALPFSAKFSNLRVRRTRFAHASAHDGGAQRPVLQRSILCRVPGPRPFVGYKKRFTCNITQAREGRFKDLANAVHDATRPRGEHETLFGGAGAEPVCALKMIEYANLNKSAKLGLHERGSRSNNREG